MVGVNHLGDAVEDLDAARDDAAAAGGQGPGEPVAPGLEEDELEFGEGVADMDAVGAGAAAPGWCRPTSTSTVTTSGRWASRIERAGGGRRRRSAG